MDRSFPKYKGKLFWEVLEFLEILEFWKFGKSGKWGAIILEIWEVLELILRGLIVTHPMTDHALRLTIKGMVCQRGGRGDHIYILHLPSYTIGCVLYKAFGVFRRLDTILPL